MAHQTYLHATPEHGRLMVMDNFYTRHLLGRQLGELSDGECKVLGTVRFNNVDAANRPALKEAIESLKHSSRGDWRLVQVFQKAVGSEYAAQVAPRSGFIVFKDRTTVTFYTNDLAATPNLRIAKPDDHSILCVHGLAPLHRWIGDEALRRTTLHVPSVIVAYNLFMNGVDRFDQFRATAASVRKEKRVPMSLFTFFLDASVLNAHALLSAITPPGVRIVDILGLKQRIIMQLVHGHLEYKQERRGLIRIAASPSRPDQNADARIPPDSSHVLLQTVGNKDVHCVLCRVTSRTLRGGYTKYSCSQCRRGFHVNCFALFHNFEQLKDSRPVVYKLIQSARKTLSSKGHRNSPNKLTATLATAKVICKQ